MKIFTLIAFLFFSQVAHAQNVSIPYLDGVPLMEGFQTSPEDVMMFDKPEGRIVEITSWCQTQCPDTKSIEDFYTKAFTALGWKQEKNHVFTHDGEKTTYEILIDSDTKNTIILFHSNG